MAANVEETAELRFGDVDYTVSVRTQGDASLAVEVEQREDATVWRAEFAARYIEEMTQRTHNFKSFPVFVRMLVTALRRESDSVFVDLLTFGDLELLKSKRAGTAAVQQRQQPVAVAAAQGPSGGSGSDSSAAVSNNKRYLILTYAAEFDRVHYPLPLQPEDGPDPRRLKGIIRQLRQQLATQQRRGAGAQGTARRQSDALPELRALREENAALKQQLRTVDCRQPSDLNLDVEQLTVEAQAAVQDMRQLRKERDALAVRSQQAEATLEGERNLHRRELRRKHKEQQDLAAELAAAKDQIRELRLKCRELTQELDLVQRRARVANMSASYLERARHVGPRPAARSAGTTPSASRGVSPVGSRQPSRGASPAPVRRAPPRPGPFERSRSAGPERPTSGPRFDPTEYVRQQRDRQRAAAGRLEEARRQQRVQQLTPSLHGSRPGSRPQSLPPSRPSSMPNSRHSTPARSRVVSRDPSAERARAARDIRDSSRERGALASSTERLRGAAVTTAYGIPARSQRAASPGKALLEVKARLRQFAAAQSGGAVGGRAAPEMGSAEGTPTALHFGKLTAHRVAAASGDSYADASTEIADIDARLQSLQQFLQAAKTGVAARAPI